MSDYEIIVGKSIDKLLGIPRGSINCVVTSPPYYGLRDYGVEGQIGMEKTPQEYLNNLVGIFSEIHRVLREDGTLWINLGDSYASSGKNRTPEQACAKTGLRGGLSSQIAASVQPSKIGNGYKPKDLMGMPWRLAFALQEFGWWLRQDIIWAKPNGMPGSQLDRCTSSHEYLFMLTKSATYWSDFDAIKTPPRESSLIRTAQNLQAQAGSHRAKGGDKSNGTMKAVGVDKQRGHSRKHAGFNARWDAMTIQEQQSMPAMMRDVWFIPPAQFADAHFAVMPDEVARRCIVAGCPAGGTVLDPFSGTGTTGIVAMANNCNYIGVEINPNYAAMSERRLQASSSQGYMFDHTAAAQEETR